MKFKLKDLVIVRRGSSPRPIMSYLSSEGYKWLKISDFKFGDKYVKSTKEFIKEDGLSGTRLVREGTLILTNSATPGIPIFLGNDMCLHDGFLYFENINSIKLNINYLYYWFLFNKNNIVNQANGSVFRNLKKEIVENLNIDIPSLDKQDKIVKILSDIDKKIEVNNKISDNLQKISKELYKRWFVDFEFPNEENKPYKISGGKMTNSELGEIPQGWEVKKLSDILNFNKRGASPKYIDKTMDGIPVINQRCIRNELIIEEAVQYHDKNKEISKELYFQKYDILINSMGVGTLGRVSQMSYLEDERIIHSCITIIRANEKFMNQVVLGCILKEMQGRFEHMGNGTTGQTSLNNKELGNIKIVCPPLKLQKELSNIIKINLDKSTQNHFEIKNLQNLRDELLPKLLRGDINLGDIVI